MKIEAAKKIFGEILREQLEKIEKIKSFKDSIDYKNLDKIIIGVIDGDGIGPIIMEQTKRIINELLKSEIDAGGIEIKNIKGLTIENRVSKMESVPSDILDEIKKCHVILKGPCTTPRAGDPWPNLTSANAVLRRELDLFSNVRPVSIPSKGVDWIFFRENIEGGYALGSKGIQVDENLAIDFVLETKINSERLAKKAFEYARNNNKSNVTVVTKANIVKTTDGNFIKACKKVGEDYKEINIVEKLADVTAARLTDLKFSKDLQVFVLPNLYGDIISDIAAEFQGGRGTAGSANLGNRYAVFEAIHGSAPAMIKSNRGQYADPSSLMRGFGMLLNHIGYSDKSKVLTRALDICGVEERKIKMTSSSKGASAEEYTDYILDEIKKLKS